MRTQSGELSPALLDTLTFIGKMTSSIYVCRTTTGKSVTIKANLMKVTLGVLSISLMNKLSRGGSSYRVTSVSYSGESKDFKEDQSVSSWCLRQRCCGRVLIYTWRSLRASLTTLRGDVHVPMGIFGGFLGLVLMSQGTQHIQPNRYDHAIGMVTQAVS